MAAPREVAARRPLRDVRDAARAWEVAEAVWRTFAVRAGQDAMRSAAGAASPVRRRRAASTWPAGTGNERRWWPRLRGNQRAVGGESRPVLAHPDLGRQSAERGMCRPAATRRPIA